MRDVARLGLLHWVHMGDLHITTDQESNYRDLLEVIDRFWTHHHRQYSHVLDH
jgi:hypothetical protein